VRGVVGEVVEEALAVHVLEGDATVPRALEQALGGVPVQLPAHDQQPAQRPGHVLAQELSDRREREAAVVLLGHDVLEGQPAQHAREDVAVRADRGGDLRAAQRPVGEHVGDAERSRDVEQLRRQVGVHEARELALRLGRRPGRVRAWMHHPAFNAGPRLPVNRGCRTLVGGQAERRA
jgi:hypothetical protein